MMKALRLIGRIFLRVMDFLWAAGGLALCAVWWTGQLARDASPETMWLYFIPPFVFIALGFAWLFFTLRHRFRLIQLVVFITVLSCFVKILVIDHRWNRAPSELPGDNIRVLHWNTDWGVLGVESIVRSINDDKPDIVVLSEPPRLDMISDIAFDALGMPHVFTSEGLTIASHYPIQYLGEKKMEDATGWHARVDTDRGSLVIIPVDVASRPSLDRAKPISRLASWIRALNLELPYVVIGDLNTPHDARALAPFRQFLVYAYAEAGRGWPYSWPVPLPCYAIDQTWVSDGITLNGFHFQQASFSYHMRQIADMSIDRPVFLKPDTP